jgi:hypothetical protein
MNKLDTTKLGGYDFAMDDLRFNDDSYRDALNNILRGFGDNFIVSGCTVNVNDISAGYIMLDGELLKVDAHVRTGNYYAKTSTFDPSGHVTMKSGVEVDIYVKYRGVCSGGAGNLAYNGTRISLPYSKAEVDQKIADLIDVAPAALNTLNELAAALGDDSNFAGSITYALTYKANTADLGNSANKNVGTTTGTVAAGDDSRFIDSREIKDVDGNTIHTKIINIGSWNMQTTASIQVTIPSTIDITKIIGIDVMIVSDSGNLSPLSALQGVSGMAGGIVTNSIGYYGAHIIQLSRGSVDGSAYDGTSYVGSDNRGRMCIRYTD